MREFTLYWSSLDRYEKCPQMFLWNRGWPTIDCGGGLGRKKPKPYQRSEHHAIMGTAIQWVIERFYNDKLWALLTPVQLRDRMLEMADEAYKLEMKLRYVDWRTAGMTAEEMQKTIVFGVMGYMRTMKNNNLIGPFSKAEMDLVAYVDQYNPIGGRADLIFRREDTGTTIIDGKNSRRYKDGKGGLMTYTDPDQLRWYALCYYLAFRSRPDRIGFCYYRYPFGDPVLDVDGKDTGKIEPGVEWVDYTEDDIKGLAERALAARKGMDKEIFPATPTYKTCRFCDYEPVCRERQASKKTRKVKGGAGEILEGHEGVMTLSFSGELKKK